MSAQMVLIVTMTLQKMCKYTQQTNDQFLSKLKGIFVLKKKRFNYNCRLSFFVKKNLFSQTKRIFPKDCHRTVWFLVTDTKRIKAKLNRKPRWRIKSSSPQRSSFRSRSDFRKIRNRSSHDRREINLISVLRKIKHFGWIRIFSYSQL